jgi:hypothetical protein
MLSIAPPEPESGGSTADTPIPLVYLLGSMHGSAGGGTPLML